MMRARKTILFISMILFLGFVQTAMAEPTYEELAAYWAPVISQDIDAENVRAEYITKFNYDGDWCGCNNWNNLDNYPLPAYVYYWVVETKTHYFIGYAFFYPRDWVSTIGEVFGHELEHENDFEGILLVIKKSDEHQYGQFVAMITAAHTDFWRYTESLSDLFSYQSTYPDVSSILFPSTLVQEGYEKIEDEVDFVLDDFGLHPVIYVQSEGHGIYGEKNGEGEYVSCVGFEHVIEVTDYAPFFDENKVTNWTNVDWNGIVDPPVSGNPSETYDKSGWNDGIIYHYEGVPDDPTKYGNPKNWQVVGYDLISIKELWNRRFDYENPSECRGKRGCSDDNKTTFQRYGTFNGDDGEIDGGNTPWHWDDTAKDYCWDVNDDYLVYKGDFFLDPAYMVDYYFDGLGEFNRTYVGSSFTDKNEFVIETFQPYENHTERWNGWGWRWEVEIENSREVDVYFDRLNIDNNGLLRLKDENGNVILLISSGNQNNYRGGKIHVPENHVIVEMDNLDDGNWGFSIRVKGNSTPYFVRAEDFEIEEGQEVDIKAYVKAEDPEGDNLTYKLEFIRNPNQNQNQQICYIDGTRIQCWDNCEGSLRVVVTDEDGNSIETEVGFTVYNVPPTCSVEFNPCECSGFDCSGWVCIPNHTITITIDDPGIYDDPWTVWINDRNSDEFGISGRWYQTSSRRLVIDVSFEQGEHDIQVSVSDKDGDSNWCSHQFYVEADELNTTCTRPPDRFAEAYCAELIHEAIKEWERAHIGKSVDLDFLGPAKDLFGVEELLERVVLYIKMRDGSTLKYRVELKNGYLKDIEEISEEELKSYNSSLRVYTDDITVVDILQSDNPSICLKYAFERGDIRIEGTDLGSNIKLGIGKFFGRIGAKFIESPYDVKPGEAKKITFRGENVILKRNPLGYIVVERGSGVPLVIDERGVVIGYTTEGIQKLIEADPAGLSPNAGILGGVGR